jgi:predicted HTH domain antitoxin
MKLELPPHLTARLEERDVLLELAAGMYAADHATLGQAAELAGVSQAELQRELGRRHIPVHFDLDDLAHDLRAAAEIAGS